MANKKSKPSYAKYATLGSYSKNKLAKLKKHLKKHPEDSQAKDATKNIKPYSRKKSENKLGWVKDTLRASLIYIPQFTTKGNMIVVRKDANNVDSLMSKFGQQAPITKELAMNLASYLRRSKTIMFNKTLVVEDKNLVWKHTSKKSNFNDPTPKES